MRALKSDYMHWAKFKKPVRFQLTTSEVPHFHMDKLRLDVADLELDGASHPRYRPLRERIGARYGLSPEKVVAADGTSMANFLAIASLIAPGDEVLIEKPTYEPLVSAASFLGATITRFDRSASRDFKLDVAAIEQVLSPRTRLVIITNLHNPSGTLATEEELRALGEVAQKARVRVLVDEVYLDAAVPAQRTSAHLGSQFVSTSSLTKVYGLSGLRCGWIISDADTAERIWRLNDLLGVNQAHQAERLACIAFDRIEEIIGEVPAMLRSNRLSFNHFVAQRNDINCVPAVHGITAFPRWAGGDSERLDAHLRERYDTAIVPGRWFELPEHFRIGFGLPIHEFGEALSRLGAALDDLS
ncbi:MAG TPA: pyridoxal phosphate-dependent aminotransferase [Sphingomicrobium sp.]|nr:pyridoxal phosphate-dependent aminotransferase [Sphingomicrobium sp.]